MTHYYKKDGLQFPSFTTIISDCENKGDALTQWAANQAVEWIRENCEFQDVTTPEGPAYRGAFIVDDDQLNTARFAFKQTSKTALDVGSEVHGAIEAYLKREIARKHDGDGHFDITDPVYAKLSKQAMNSFNAFNAWYKEHNVKPIALEHTVYGNGCAGTLDFLGYFNDKLYVIDWKSSKAHYKSMAYQVAAYRDACRKQEHERVEGCGVLRLDKETGIPDFKDTSKTYLNDLRVFNAMVNLYFTKHPRIAKNAGIPF